MNHAALRILENLMASDRNTAFEKIVNLCVPLYKKEPERTIAGIEEHLGKYGNDFKDKVIERVKIEGAK